MSYPHIVYPSASDCYLMLLLWIAGDVDENPGPGMNSVTETLLQTVLAGEATIGKNINAIKDSFTKNRLAQPNV